MYNKNVLSLFDLILILNWDLNVFKYNYLIWKLRIDYFKLNF
jgi:hypothetical protein